MDDIIFVLEIAIPVTAFLLIAIWRTYNRSAWNRLAKQYRAGYRIRLAEATRWRNQQVIIGKTKYPFLQVYADNRGLYFKRLISVPLLSHPPLYFPWRDITGQVNTTHDQIGVWVNLYFAKATGVPVQITSTLAENLEDINPGNWMYSRV